MNNQEFLIRLAELQGVKFSNRMVGDFGKVTYFELFQQDILPFVFQVRQNTMSGHYSRIMVTYGYTSRLVSMDLAINSLSKEARKLALFNLDLFQ